MDYSRWRVVTETEDSVFVEIPKPLWNHFQNMIQHQNMMNQNMMMNPFMSMFQSPMRSSSHSHVSSPSTTSTSSSSRTVPNQSTMSTTSSTRRGPSQSTASSNTSSSTGNVPVQDTSRTATSTSTTANGRTTMYNFGMTSNGGHYSFFVNGDDIDGSIGDSDEDLPDLISDDETEEIKQIDVSKSKMEEEIQCSICFDTFKDVQSMDCSHYICKECIQHLNKLQCPVCRYEMNNGECTPEIKKVILENGKEYRRQQQQETLRQDQEYINQVFGNNIFSSILRNIL